jgi:hypothetical protein
MHATERNSKRKKTMIGVIAAGIGEGKLLSGL